MKIYMDLKTFRPLVDQRLQAFFDDKLDQYQEMGLPQRIMEIVSYVKEICATGKRVRPYLTFISYKAFGGKQDEELMRFALGFELFHSFALVHDDVFDQGEMRRGVPSYHTHIQTMLQSDQAAHIAQSQAVLMGDLLFSWTQEVIYDEYDLEPAFLQKARKNFQHMLNEIIIGEMMDVDFMT